MTTVTELLQPVEADLEILLSDLRSLIGAGTRFCKLLLSICSAQGESA